MSSHRVMLYIDGFNLYFGMKSKQWRRYYWLDLHALAESLLKPNQVLVGLHYFTARVSNTLAKPDKGTRQKRYLEALAAHSQLTISYGHYLHKETRCFKCNATWQRPEEKMTDVNIACAMLQDAYLDRYDTAIVISGDSDLVPPARAVRTAFPNKRLIVAFPPERHSKQMRQVYHGSLSISEAMLRQSQLPDPVVKPDGYALNRPAEWQ